MSLMSSGRAKERALFAADNSPRFPFSAAAAAHKSCSGVPCPASSQTRIGPSNNAFANRVLQQTDECARALHMWSVHHFDGFGQAAARLDKLLASLDKKPEQQEHGSSSCCPPANRAHGCRGTTASGQGETWALLRRGPPLQQKALKV